MLEQILDHAKIERLIRGSDFEDISVLELNGRKQRARVFDVFLAKVKPGIVKIFSDAVTMQKPVVIGRPARGFKQGIPNRLGGLGPRPNYRRASDFGLKACLQRLFPNGGESIQHGLVWGVVLFQKVGLSKERFEVIWNQDSTTFPWQLRVCF